METTPDQDLGGELVLKGLKKIQIGCAWEPNKRESLIVLLKSEKARLQKYAQEMRKRCKWEAPYFAENEEKVKDIDRMIFFLGIFSPHQLELNRANFLDYVE